ncbi:MAG: hypothetical protein AB1782_18505 [Cyanobacteriota bacterium]
MENESIFIKQKTLAIGVSPLQVFFETIEPMPENNWNTDFKSLVNEIKQSGYSRKPFQQIRKILIDDNNQYDLSKLVVILKESIKHLDNIGHIKSIAEENTDSSWGYTQNIIEYVNIRSLGINDNSNKTVRSGTILDLIVYLIQSRSSIIHLAPFHNCSMNLLYSPSDTYSILTSLVSEELLCSGFSPEAQLKLALDFGHARKEKTGFIIDCLPHTSDLSLNYIFKPESARWISLNPDYISENKRIFCKGKKIINLTLTNSVDQIDLKDLSEIFNLNIQQLNKILDNYSLKSTDKKNELVTKLLRKKLILKTHLVENKNDISILIKNAEKQWNSGLNAEYTLLISSKEHSENCKKVTDILQNKLGKNYSYEDIQKASENYNTSPGKKLRELYYIYNLPVGAWNGGPLELVGFHIRDNYPIFATRGIGRSYWRCPHDRKGIDVSDKIFGTNSRRKFRYETGERNSEAINEFINTYVYWLVLGFDGLRLDQMNHVYHDEFKYTINGQQELQEYFRDNDFSYDTMLKEDIEYFIHSIKEKISYGLYITTENMMHYPIPASNTVYEQLNYLGADSIIGNFQFMETMPKLLLRLQEHNLIKMYQKTNTHLLGTVECHDNNLTLGGTSPVCKSADGLTIFRIRLLINSIGLPYITTQAIQAINHNKHKDCQIQNSINNILNLNFKESSEYFIGDKKYSFDNFRHNYFDFVERPEIKTILKGGIIKVHNNKLTENSGNNLLFFTVHNKSPNYLLFVINASEETKEDVWLNNTNFDWYNGPREVIEYKLDKTYLTKVEPIYAQLVMINEDKKHHALSFGTMLSGEIRIYLI